MAAARRLAGALVAIPPSTAGRARLKPSRYVVIENPLAAAGFSGRLRGRSRFGRAIVAAFRWVDPLACVNRRAIRRLRPHDARHHADREREDDDQHTRGDERPPLTSVEREFVRHVSRRTVNSTKPRNPKPRRTVPSHPEFPNGPRSERQRATPTSERQRATPRASVSERPHERAKRASPTARSAATTAPGR